MTNRPDPRWIDRFGGVIDEADRGLVYDVQTLIDRRRALGIFGVAGAAGLLAACGVPLPSSPGGTSPGSLSTTGSGAVVEVPDDARGPFPGDGSSSVNVLDDSGIVRSDIRSSFGSSTTTALGVTLTIKLTVRDAASGDALTGAAVYVWHCDREGRYSLYSQGVTDENYLRGVQEVGAGATATFTTTFPGCYPGRWPHIHFEVYDRLRDAVSSGPIVKTSQIALPKEACEVVYATEGYESSVRCLSQTSLSRDGVFGDDGGIHQLASMSGDTSAGYTAALTIGV